MNEWMHFTFFKRWWLSLQNNKKLKMMPRDIIVCVRIRVLYKYLFDADILIADISAILSDYLYFNKPIILFKPECIKDIEEECPISKCAYIVDYKTNLAEVIEKIKSDDYLLEKRNLMREYIMGNKNITFDQALEKVSNY